MGVGLVCVVKELIPKQIDEFAPRYWAPPLFLDEVCATAAAAAPPPPPPPPPPHASRGRH